MNISITEVTVSSGKKKTFRLNVDGIDVKIPIAGDLYAYCDEQFFRGNPTPAQRKRFATLINLMRASYKQGVIDSQVKKK